MNVQKLFGAMSLALTLLIGCAHSPEGLTAQQLQTFSMETSNGTEVSTSFSALVAEFPVTFSNPNPLAGNVQDIQWVLRRAGNTIASGQVDAVELAAKESKEVKVRVSLDLIDNAALENVEILRTQFAIVGFVEAGDVRKKLLAKTPFEAVLPTRPVLKVDAGIARYGNSRVEMLIGVEIDNNNRFAIPVTSLEYTFNLDGESLKSGSIDSPRTLPAGAATAYDFSELLEATEKPEWVAKLTSSKENIPFEMRMKLSNSDESFELAFSGEMSLE